VPAQPPEVKKKKEDFLKLFLEWKSVEENETCGGVRGIFFWATPSRSRRAPTARKSFF
jgi:hypothetical protein